MNYWSRRLVLVTLLFGCLNVMNVLTDTLADRLVVQNEKKSWHEASGSCENFTSALALSEAFKSQLLQQLQDGEKAWLSGRCLLSGFIAWDRCINMSHPELSGHNYTEIDQNVNPIYKCAKLCNGYFIGLVERKCFCLRSIKKDAVVQNNNCNIHCDDGFRLKSSEICGGLPNFASTYALEDVTVSPADGNFQQGLYVVYNGSTVDNNPTVNLISLYQQVNGGYVCRDPATGNPTACDSEKRWCWYTSSGVSLEQAMQACKSHRGAGLRYSQLTRLNVSGIIPANKPVLTGTFRSFQMDFEGIPREQDACPVVKNANGILVVEPERCSTAHRLVCTGSSIDSQGDKCKSKVLLIALIISGLVLLVILAVFVIILYRRSKKRHRQGLPQNASKRQLTSKKSEVGIDEETDEGRCKISGATSGSDVYVYSQVVRAPKDTKIQGTTLLPAAGGQQGDSESTRKPDQRSLRRKEAMSSASVDTMPGEMPQASVGAKTALIKNINLTSTYEELDEPLPPAGGASSLGNPPKGDNSASSDDYDRIDQRSPMKRACHDEVTPKCHDTAVNVYSHLTLPGRQGDTYSTSTSVGVAHTSVNRVATQQQNETNVYDHVVR